MQKLFKARLLCAAAVGLVVLASGAARAESSVEVMHFWTSGGEAAALNEVKKKVEAEGVSWVDAPIAGGGGETMVKVFDQMRALRGMVDENFSGRDWNLATAMVIENKAAMQIMGDWSKGEFTNAGKKAGTDFLCFAAPGTAADFVFLVNSFSMFEQPNADAKKAQAILANAIMDPEVQLKFNIAKGSIPAVSDAPTDGLDDCALKNVSDLAAASKGGTALPTVAYTHAADAAVTAAITDVVTRHFNSDLASKDAAAELVQAIAAAR